jgi:hypothetical protein
VKDETYVSPSDMPPPLYREVARLVGNDVWEQMQADLRELAQWREVGKELVAAFLIRTRPDGHSIDMVFYDEYGGNSIYSDIDSRKDDLSRYQALSRLLALIPKDSE